MSTESGSEPPTDEQIALAADGRCMVCGKPIPSLQSWTNVWGLTGHRECVDRTLQSSVSGSEPVDTAAMRFNVRNTEQPAQAYRNLAVNLCDEIDALRARNEGLLDAVERLNTTIEAQQQRIEELTAGLTLVREALVGPASSTTYLPGGTPVPPQEKARLALQRVDALLEQESTE